MHEARIVADARDALHVELVHSTLEPFAMHAVSRVVWGVLQQRELVLSGMRLSVRRLRCQWCSPPRDDDVLTH